MKIEHVASVAVLLLSLSTPALAIDNAAWLKRVEGFFASQSSKTPIGEIPFAMDLTRESDGSVHGRTWAGKDSYFDFKFYLNPQDELLFHETGALPGGLVQSHILEVTKVEGDTVTFESKQSPGLLVAHVTADDRQLHVISIVRGRQHANLQMMRVTAPQAIAAFRASNAATREKEADAVVQLVAQTVAQSAFRELTGNYETPQPGMIVAIKLDGGKLLGQPTGGEAREMKPGQDGAFSVDGQPFNIRFIRDDKGQVTHMQLMVNGQESMRLRKVQ